ncbi:MAG: polysaccharide deacetylase family protein [Armatimonadetes bacterium]|nr:polysaccharide deacetylase family protein [Armatimonadota bacterium]
MNREVTSFGTSVVLLYHRIGPMKLSSHVAGQYVCPRVFAWGIDGLRQGKWQATSLDACIKYGTEGGENSEDHFAITFDDGYLSVYEHACPILKDRDMTATVYVVVDTLGGINLWDKRAGDKEEKMMSADQARELAESGFEIGSHTLTHPRLANLNDDELIREIVDSKQKLEDIIQQDVTSLSYPYGNFDGRVLNAAAAAGYKNAVSTKLGTIIEGTSMFEIPRINVRWNGFGWHLRRKIRRATRATEIQT